MTICMKNRLPQHLPTMPLTFLSRKKTSWELVSCFLTQTTNDMNSIGRHNQLSSSIIKGGEVKVTCSNVRAAGGPIKKIEAYRTVFQLWKLLKIVSAIDN